MRFSTALAQGLLASSVSAIATIEIKGNKFFKSTGEQFYLKGIAYQLRPSDPLIDTEQCTRDATLMKTLGVNSIRVYHVDPKADHSGCMSAFANAGIYLIVDLDDFDTYILGSNPYWNQTQFDRYAATMDEFIKYDNTLGFWIANEAIFRKNESAVAPFLKAATRDMKAYRDARGYRKAGIGYSAADIAELRPMTQDYLTCGGNASESIDFFGLNSYSWCDPSSYTQSGYDRLNAMAKDFPVPIFFSETGCNVPGPRLFADQASILGPDMADLWSGAIVYEWIEEQNHYGLVSYGPKVDQSIVNDVVYDGFTRKGVPTPVQPDFNNLKSQWATLNPTGISAAAYVPTVSTRDCPRSTPGGWEVDGNVRLPTLGESYTYAPLPTQSRGSGSGSGSGGSGTSGNSPSGTGPDGSSSTNAGSHASGNMVVTMGGALMGVFLIFIYWL